MKPLTLNGTGFQNMSDAYKSSADYIIALLHYMLQSIELVIKFRNNKS